jgi:hypothetical protein
VGVGEVDDLEDFRAPNSLKRAAFMAILPSR